MVFWMSYGILIGSYFDDVLCFRYWKLLCKDLAPKDSVEISSIYPLSISHMPASTILMPFRYVGLQLPVPAGAGGRCSPTYIEATRLRKASIYAHTVSFFEIALSGLIN